MFYTENVIKFYYQSAQPIPLPPDRCSDRLSGTALPNCRPGLSLFVRKVIHPPVARWRPDGKYDYGLVNGGLVGDLLHLC